MSSDRQLIVVANRLPVRNVNDDDGQRWVTSPGGLVSALAPVMADREKVSWVGWTGSAGRAPEPFMHDRMLLHPVSLSRADLQLYYEGFSNGTLWPLYHDSTSEPEFHRTWWDAYVSVNHRFAEAVVSLAEPNATVWIHDYQLQLVPGMLRQLRPDMKIGFFLHIPWPARELFLRLPWRSQIVRALLGADIIGFQTDVVAHNFRHVVPRVTDAEVNDVEDDLITFGDRRVLAKTHPIGIDYDRFAGAARQPETDDAVEELRQTLHNPRRVLLGVDRLDYTKGIERRLRAYGELLDEERLNADDVVLIQIAEPSRSNVNGYAGIRAQVEQQVGEINGTFGTMTRPAVHYRHRSHGFEELIAMYRLADVMLVTPFRDGMNLVAKEYVATRHDLSGALVLSEFAGAAHELGDAVIVNPYDVDGLKEAIEFAATMRPDEQRSRMSPMRDAVSHNTRRALGHDLPGRPGAVMTEPMTLAHLQEIARTPALLIACDYDGTLSPLVNNPQLAFPHRESIAALRALASFPDTHVAVVSGRSLRDLAALSRLPAEIHLVGSHGSEFDAGFVSDLDDRQIQLRTEITNALSDLARDSGIGFTIEKKPASVAFHYRNADPDEAQKAVRAILDGPAQLPGVDVKNGKMVIELTVVTTNKGTAIDILRRQVAADAVLFMGDDVTDEDAFAVLTGPDLGVKIGEGETKAHVRLDDTEATARQLALLCEIRRAWLQGENSPGIEQHSMLSDQRTIALVTPDARVTWMCHPRADSPAVFAELIGGAHAGYFAVRPASDVPPMSQRYLPGTLILETRWPELMVTDYLDASFGRTAEAAGRTDLIRVLEGAGRAVIEFAPRLDYGRAPTLLEVVPDGVLVRGIRQTILLRAPHVHWEIVEDGAHQTAKAEIDLAGASLVLEVAFDAVDGPRRIETERRASTAEHWTGWANTLDLPPVASDAVLRSALTIKGLCHQPTGAMLAAATTSLPEVPGGVRNWDYRYCWPRDASLSACALVELGSLAEAHALLAWILERVGQLPGPEQLRPLYALAGDEFLPEAVLPTLNGYLGSRPVRIGNAADQQVQLDVFGPVVELAYRLARRDEPITDAIWQLVQDMVAAVSRRWHEPDHGIWEERRPQRHHVHSKVMCWMAVDRAMCIGKLTRRHVPTTWRPLRQLIAADVIARGWNPGVGAYTIAYGDTELDASVLWIGLSGLLPASDPRFVATVKAIERELRNGAIVYRYRLDDGLPGDEGGFLICTAWLIEAYVMLHQYEDARILFDRYLDLAGHTGLLSEAYEPSTKLMLGNHPQAYSHLGLINAALALHRARP